MEQFVIIHKAGRISWDKFIGFVGLLSTAVLRCCRTAVTAKI
jgi:hypothetical protein